MENSPSQSLTLFSEKGTIKSISNNKLVLASDRGVSLEIYVPSKIPHVANDHVEVTFELTEHGFIGRRINTLPILPIDFLILTEYLRFGFISIISMLGFLIVGFIFPVYFLSILLPVLLGFFTVYYYAGAVKIGQHVPNYNHATISPFGALSPEQKTQFFTKGVKPPLFAMDATLALPQETPTKGHLLHSGREFPLLSPVRVDLKKFNNVEGSWIVSIRNGQTNVLGKMERTGNISWILNPLLSCGLLFEVIGYVIFFLSIIPGFLLYGFGAPVPLPGDLLSSLFIACMFVGCCLILVGKIASLKKKRIQNNLIVDYKGS